MPAHTITLLLLRYSTVNVQNEANRSIRPCINRNTRYLISITHEDRIASAEQLREPVQAHSGPSPHKHRVWDNCPPPSPGANQQTLTTTGVPNLTVRIKISARQFSTGVSVSLISFHWM